ncbi:unnamed protein product [Citrullus colocynthis]|uniref:Uncharacterized protein n=1 Tax=Citrullus colocynthis TaxID=252529 RepID=A0ABP0ZED4_9ROSI
MMRFTSVVHLSASMGSSSQASLPGEAANTNFFPDVAGTYPLPPTIVATAKVSHHAADNYMNNTYQLVFLRL